MDNSTKTIIAIAVVLIVIIGGYYMWKSPSQPAETGPIKIGLSSPMTGELASYGDGFYGGAALAVKEINDAGGINGRKIELVIGDDQCNPSVAVSAMTKLTSIDKVIAVVGPMCSAAAGASASVAQAAGIPTLLTASAPGLTKAGNYIFRNYPSDSAQGKFAAEFVYNKLSKKKAAVIYVKNDWGQGLNDVFTERFKQLGGEIVYSESILQTSTDLRTQIAKAKAANPDILYFAVYVSNSIAGLKQIKNMGLNIPILGGDAFLDDSLVKLPEASGILFTSGKTNNPADFQDKVKQVSNKTPNGFTPYAYDAIKTLAQVIEKVGTDSKAIANELSKASFKESVAIPVVEFGSDRELKTVDFDIKIIKDGKAVEYTQ